jgi:S-adenosylmethionine:diacylglycerol 3-amino-3-carboxypropyl transferase
MSVTALELASQQTQLFETYGLGNISALQEAERGVGTAPKDFSPDHQKAYPFTTENINSYLGTLSLTDAKVLAICGSGDFGFSAVMAGAQSVDQVDALKTATLYAELKAVGLQSLDFEAYKRFFGSTSTYTETVSSPGRMEYDTYSHLRDGLSVQTRSYFDQLITPSGRSPYLEHGFIINKATDVAANMAMVPYLNDEASYLAAGSSRAKSRFHPSTMEDFVASLEPGSYDTVYLSNIENYLAKEGYLDLLRGAVRTIAEGGIVIETGFFNPSVRDVEQIEQTKQEQALKIGLTACPTVIAGTYLPLPTYSTHATIYHNEI